MLAKATDANKRTRTQTNQLEAGDRTRDQRQKLQCRKTIRANHSKYNFNLGPTEVNQFPSHGKSILVRELCR